MVPKSGWVTTIVRIWNNTRVKSSTWKVCMTWRSKQQQVKLENRVTLQIFYLLTFLKPINLKLKIMIARLRISREKLTLDKVVINEYQSTRKLNLLLLHFWVYFFDFSHHYYTVPNAVFIFYNATIWKERGIMSRFSNFFVHFKNQGL